ncbi:MAG TPA: precorrin-4 C(11)-methyltransferase [Methanospirillum sp.]|uniref:precorrin-4 C(11)-methyltransferase n=1 Tax=Methanospirillum sp. TaxID=45200 RepID=UPI002BC76B9C|nr:precorrin-4 C(11)-methyltransferase [Methanospirillum sp.]HOJ97096.1 precorrin-4 C(11)-methyltransferase [Methanospirillum sp.]HOL40916.1 precorrin-4 C(11)-methyltransferase [Methanospirillum sp.]HPP78753.1 precorrin-4 C(11)-methyltransferase [Methanospirillum sp.]
MNSVWFVGAGPGDPDLITVKGLTLLKAADILIYAGSLVNPDLVQLSSAPFQYDSNGMSLEEMIPIMVKGVREGKIVVRLHSGDPALYGAIIEQIDLLKKEGISAQIVPGVSSLFGAAAALQAQLTLRGVSESVIITRPAGKTLEKDRIAELSQTGETMAIFLGTEKLEEITSRLVCHPDTTAVVVYHATWPDQKIVRGTVKDIARKAYDAGITKSALLLVGEVFAENPKGHIRSFLYS